jgi:TRAP-type C4-dicarboxylate transport system substrate-binding protein
MKKFIALLLALAMVLVLAACGSKETTSNAGSGSTASTSTSSGGSTASSGSSTDTTAADDAEADAYHVDIIYSNVFNPAEWNYKAAEKFAEMVTERTEGHITVTYHGLNELDCYADSVVHAVNGDKWIGLEEPSLFADYVGDCAVLVGRCCTTTTPSTTMSWIPTSSRTSRRASPSRTSTSSTLTIPSVTAAS